MNFLQKAENNWTIEILQNPSDPTGRICWSASHSTFLFWMYWSYDFKQPCGDAPLAQLQ